MATTKTDYSPHKQYVGVHFGWPRAAYKTKVLKDAPGLRIEHPQQGIFQVETLAERIAVCQECLLSFSDASEVSRDIAALALESTPPEPDLVEQVLDLLDQIGLADDREGKRRFVRLYTSIAGDSIRDFWRGIGLMDPWFLAAGLLVVERASEPGALARQLADLYFTYPQYLSPLQGGRVGRASVGELQLALYQVHWGPDGEPVPVPNPEERETVETAGSGGKKRAARRRAI